MTPMNLREYLAHQQKLVEAELDRLVPPENSPLLSAGLLVC